jgi:hypothetical protein
VEAAQRIAILGWSALGAEVLHEIDHVLGPGSAVVVLVDPDYVRAADVAPPALRNASVHVADLADGPKALLAAVDATQYDHAIVLSYRQGLTADQADARTMLTLLTLHKAWAGRPHRPRVVAEMLDRTNVAIAGAIEVDDFIVSDELSSLMLAQVSERRELDAVFRDLFDAAGCALSLRPAPQYVADQTLPFSAVVAAAARRAESAIGYRCAGQAAVVNPAKSAQVTLGTRDRVLVLGRRPDSHQAGERLLFPGRELHVPAEGLPHGGQQLVGVDRLAAAAEPREQ